MQYLVSGGKPLSGEIAVSGAKNVALKLLIAALLTKGKTVLTNIPQIRDVLVLVEIINYLGGSARFTGPNTVEVENQLKNYEIPLEMAAKTRVSFMLIAPLLLTLGKAKIPNPGGCRLGARPVDRLVMSLESFGCKINYHSEDGFYYADINKAHSGEIVFPKKSHTGTELAVMFASRIPNQSIIHNAALEPEIDDMIAYLSKAGAKVKRSGENIIVNGKEELKATDFKIQYDRNEAVSYIILAALFTGKVIVKNVDLKSLTTFLKKFREAGFDYQYNADDLSFQVIPAQKIKPVDVETSPEPGFMTDWQPMWALLMTQAKGVSHIHETVHENRFGYVSELLKLGAKIDFYQPKLENPQAVYQFNLPNNNLTLLKQAIKISGPTKLHNGVVKVSDLRAGACLLLATLVASGKSVLEGVEQIERGYENIIVKLQQIGAKLKLSNGH